MALIVLGSATGYGQCVNCNSLDEALKKPENVKSLKINAYQNEITLDSLTASIGKLINVEIIYLTDHNITSIPKEIGDLKKLKELSFSGCHLTEIPDEIFLLKNLKELILLDNEFTEEYIQKFKTQFSKELPGAKLMISAAEY